MHIGATDSGTGWFSGSAMGPTTGCGGVAVFVTDVGVSVGPVVRGGACAWSVTGLERLLGLLLELECV